MPRIKEKTVYKFDELDERAKEKAREWYRDGVQDHEWLDAVYDDAKQCLALAGFDIDRIYFSGFSSQGDGACFEGSWRASDSKPVKAMKQHAPKDKELHRIAAVMRAIGRRYPQANMSVKQRGHYQHEGCTQFSVDLGNDDDKARTAEQWAAKREAEGKVEDEIIECSRDAMRWIYRTLEREYAWLMSDEQVDESIRANEYEFDENGRIA
jgi:hypothetical protein